MRIAVDIDGVLFPWDEVARDTLADRFGTLIPPSDRWHAVKDAVGRDAWDWLWSAEGQHTVFSQNDRRYADAVLAVNDLLRAGHEVHFVTHRDPRHTLHHTAEFLRRYFGRGPAWAGVHSVKSRTTKSSLARWDVLVDDRPKTVLGVAGQETTMVFMPRRSWNTEVDDGPHVHVYDDPRDIVTWTEGRTLVIAG